MSPWEVFDLVSHYLDPKALVISCCVCKSWFSGISSDHIWKPICTSHFPNLSTLKLVDPSLTYYRLYSVASSAAKRRFQSPSKPRLALDDVIFAVNLFSLKSSSNVLALVKPGSELVADNRVFKFDIVVDKCEFEAMALEAVRVTWHVVLRGWGGLFSMLDCQGKRGVGWWFWEELPFLACCCNLVDSGVVADLRLGIMDNIRGDVNYEKKKFLGINKITVGMLSTSKLRYLSVDDGLRYLQHFLL